MYWEEDHGKEIQADVVPLLAGVKLHPVVGEVRGDPVLPDDLLTVVMSHKQVKLFIQGFLQSRIFRVLILLVIGAPVLQDNFCFLYGFTAA